MVHINIEIDGYNQAFVERFHPYYNCDEVAWLDDCYCALNNESENKSHWYYLIEVATEEWERDFCQAIFDEIATDEEIEAQLKYEGFSSIDNFGAYLANKYKDTIEEDIQRFEAIIMEEAKKGFYKEFGINED